MRSLAQPDSAQLGSVRRGLAQLRSTLLGPAQLGLAQFDLARLDSTRLDMFQIKSSNLGRHICEGVSRLLAKYHVPKSGVIFVRVCCL